MLPFTKPTTAKAGEMQRGGADLLFASFRCDESALTGEPLTTRKSTYRNILAWYLSAAGLASSAVAAYLDISVSRANALANTTRTALYRSPWSIRMMRSAARAEGIESLGMAKHLFQVRRMEMHAAEHALAVCTPSDLLVVSGALRLGRGAYATELASFEGQRCACRLCKSIARDLSPYWEDATENSEAQP